MFSSNTSQVADGGYQISRSLRFNSADNAYLIRTPASAGNRKTWTWSAWVKRSELGVRQQLFNARPGSSEVIEFFDETISVFEYTGASIYNIRTNQVFRDPSAWYHIVVFKDTTQATDTNRMKVYVNGVQITSLMTASYPTLNSESYINSTVDHHIGCTVPTALHFGGYMTEVNFIDGQALTPSSFGETNAQTGVWQPKAYSGSYGTNGFYLNFSDNSNTTAATLGKDYSGNGNNWTPNNFSVSAGAGNDSLVDTPTPYGGDSGAGGEVRGNYCTLNPLFKVGAGTPSYANGNLDMTAGGTGDSYFAGTTVLTEGKWYYEATITSVGSGILIGVCRVTDSQTIGNLGSYRNTSVIYNLDGTTQTAGATYTTNDVIGVAIDIDNGTVKFYKNNVGQGATNSFTFTAGTPLIVRGRSNSTTSTVTFNFGQRPFAYTAPSGFKALCTQNLPTPTIGATTATQAGKYFNPVLYTGDRTSRTIDVGFQPDWVWVKSRNAADDHYLMNAVVGTGKYLVSNSTAAEVTNAASLTAFTSNGFSIGNTGTTNETGRTYVAWNWKANGAGSTNTAGSITSTVSANTTSGFSIATYTGAAGTGGTVGHGLGAAPRMVIVKCRGANTSTSWAVYHASLGAGNYLKLNDTSASASSTDMWNNTAPTSTVFSVGTLNNWASGSSLDTYVAYCFAEVPGYSRFGSYTGNGSSAGPFVFTGFKPAFVLIKRTDDIQNWFLMDNKRNPANAVDNYLMANSSDAAADFVPSQIDFLSNGFKLLGTAAGLNASGGSYIYMAVAENPFKFALAR